MRKTIEKEEVKVNESEVKKEFNLEEAFVLWRNKSKAGNFYLRGKDLHDNKLVGFFNTKKKNPNEPDIRICEINVDANGNETTGNEICSLWDSEAKSGNRYLTGTTDEKEKIVAFYGKENEEARPYIRAYFRELDK